MWAGKQSSSCWPQGWLCTRCVLPVCLPRHESDVEQRAPSGCLWVSSAFLTAHPACPALQGRWRARMTWRQRWSASMLPPLARRGSTCRRSRSVPAARCPLPASADRVAPAWTTCACCYSCRPPQHTVSICTLVPRLVQRLAQRDSAKEVVRALMLSGSGKPWPRQCGAGGRWENRVAACPVMSCLAPALCCACGCVAAPCTA